MHVATVPQGVPAVPRGAQAPFAQTSLGTQGSGSEKLQAPPEATFATHVRGNVLLVQKEFAGQFCALLQELPIAEVAQAPAPPSS
jgi:hypothetical protein